MPAEPCCDVHVRHIIWATEPWMQGHISLNMLQERVAKIIHEAILEHSV